MAARFAPKTAGNSGDQDKTDLLITTDVLAEGVNLQQADILLIMICLGTP